MSRNSDVRIFAFDEAKGLGAVAGNTDDVEFRPRRGQAIAQIRGKVRLVIGDERARGRCVIA